MTDENGFFSDRLYRELNGSMDEANVLAKALGGWTALQIIDRIGGASELVAQVRQLKSRLVFDTG